jgi:Dolichyl-phosphate-mannose-protein mannosyltransferase
LESEPGRPSRDRDLWFSAALFLLALVPRLYVALAWPREPVWDGHYYDFGARRIAEGLGYSDDVLIGGHPVWHPWCHYPVGYSGFLAAFYWLFGAGPRVGPVANAVVGALTAVVVHRLARFGTTTTRARVAGALTAVHPGLIAYSALLMTEPLAGFGLLLAAWLFVRDRDRPLRAGALSGLVIGLSTLVRPPSLLLAPALIFFTAKISTAEGSGSGEESAVRVWLRRAAGPAAACAFTLLAILPWTARNCRVMDGCALVSTNAGWNLMIGAFPRATGRFETIRATDGCPIATGQVQQDRCWMDTGISHIAGDPLRWLSLAPKKLGYTFDHESFPIGYLGEANPVDWPEARRERGRAVLGWAHRLLLALAALAAVPLPMLRRDRQSVIGWAALLLVLGLVVLGLAADTHPVWPLAVAAALLPALPLSSPERRGGVIAYSAFLVGTVAVVSIVFFGEDRYHMVASPAMCLLAACALRRPAESARH